MTKREREQLHKAIEQMCSLYCQVPREAGRITSDFEDWFDAVEEACEECPLMKFERGKK